MNLLHPECSCAYANDDVKKSYDEVTIGCATELNDIAFAMSKDYNICGHNMLVIVEVIARSIAVSLTKDIVEQDELLAAAGRVADKAIAEEINGSNQSH